MKSMRWVFAPLLCCICIPTFAQVPTNAFPDFEKKIKSAEMVSPLKAELFGDSVSLYNGSTEFAATDVDVPGNNALPVRLGRRFKVAVKTNATLTGHGFSPDIQPLGGFGAWDIDVPFLYGMFDGSYGWKVGSLAQTNRCSGAVLPRVTSPFEVNDIWAGYHLHIPGKGEQELMTLGTANQKPTDGNVYPWGTRDLHRARCISSMANYPGEGFVVVDTAGTSYTFDYAITRSGGVIEKAGLALARQQVFLMARHVQDRHGNYVDYQYVGDRLTRISSSDGRVIDVHWTGSSISSVVAHGKEWKYTYGATMTVEQPDQSKWIYQPIGALSVTPAPPLDDGGACSESLPATAAPFSMVVTHPSGAQGRFDFGYVRHGRSGTPASACTVDSIDEFGQVHRSLKLPDYSYTYSLLLKTITGPGLDEMRWEYSWEDPAHGRVDLDPMSPYCGFCDPDKSAFVKEPSGVTKQYVFGALWNFNEGRLLATYTRDQANALVKSEVLEYVSEAEVQSGVPFPATVGQLTASDNSSGLYNRPVKKTTITQDQTTFTSSVLGFDAFARPLTVKKGSSLGYEKTEATEYYDSPALWTLGQVQKQSIVGTNIVTSETEYYPSTALPFRVYGPGTTTARGKLLQEIGYNPVDATISTVKDGMGRTTVLSGWKRGVPQSISYPDTTAESADVHDLGWIMSVTDENSFTTSYEYDGMGRLSHVVYPIGDSTLWNDKWIAFQQVSSDEYGIAAGHWRQVVTQGNYKKVTYFDAMWRPVVEQEEDVSNSSETLRWKTRRFDSSGNVTFESYPRNPYVDGWVNAGAAVTGTHTFYDPLDRVRLVEQDSELGERLKTTTNYLPGFKREIINPRGFSTTQSFEAYDTPTYDLPINIDSPQGVKTTITRNILGKPTSVSRTGPDG